MGAKRPTEASEEGTPKRQRQNRSFQKARTGAALVDPTYGQRGAFGDLLGVTTAPAGDSDLDCEDDSEALAYLRSVRQQAFTIPHVLVAQKAGPSPPPRSYTSATAHDPKEEDEEASVDRSIYQDGRGDFRGYYHDGAYTALPQDYYDDLENDEDDDEEEDGECADEEGEEAEMELDIQQEDSPESSDGGPHNSSSDEIRDAYFASLTKQYLALRNVLRKEPPESVLRSLPPSNSHEVEEFQKSRTRFLKWAENLRGMDPLPAQIAGMRKDSVMRLLTVVLAKFLKKKAAVQERISRWIWALLARLPEKGELDYREIGLVRELGKRAILLMVNLAELEVLNEHYEIGLDSSNDSQNGVNGDGEEHDSSDESVSQGSAEDYDVDEDEGEVERSNPQPESGSRFDNFTETPNPSSFIPMSLSSEKIVEVAQKEETIVLKGGKTVVDVTAASAISTNGNDDTVTLSDTGKDARGMREAAELPEISSLSAEILDTERQADSSDVEMQLESDVEDGEVLETTSPIPSNADLDLAKNRLLATLEHFNKETLEVSSATTKGPPSPAPSDQSRQRTDNGIPLEPEETEENAEAEAEAEVEAEAEAERVRERERDARQKMNERATLNMILTVAGEFYGQRDLLEFRDPFGGGFP